MTTGKLYGGYWLRRGDHDRHMIWGGRKGVAPASHVQDLQKDLRAIGVYSGRLDGDFGPKTETAGKLFQWNAKNFSHRLQNGQQVSDTFSAAVAVSGSVDMATASELARWKAHNYMATGDLVRVPILRLSCFELGDGFKRIRHPSIQAGEMVVSAQLQDAVSTMNAKAAELGVRVVVNQAVRVVGVAVSGAVVAPATRSQHFIGHAIDCNIVDGDSWNTSADFRNGRETEKAKKLIAALKEAGLRWGGDFTETDTPHFDKQLAEKLAYDSKYFFNQKMLADKQPIPLAVF